MVSWIPQCSAPTYGRRNVAIHIPLTLLVVYFLYFIVILMQSTALECGMLIASTWICRYSADHDDLEVYSTSYLSAAASLSGWTSRALRNGLLIILAEGVNAHRTCYYMPR